MVRKLAVRCDSLCPALVVEKHRHWQDKMAYVLCADRRIKSGKNGRLKNGGSRIIYIGMTGKLGKQRPAFSLVEKADYAFKLHGVRRVHAHLVTCKPKRNVKTWKELEKALLATFKNEYGDLPKYNDKGEKFSVDRIRDFDPKRIRIIINALSVGVR
jgi:hypothetical protein